MESQHLQDKFIRDFQKFINGIFTYDELRQYADRQRDFLLKVIDKIPDNEYNALWDTLSAIESKFSVCGGLKIATETSVLLLFNYHIKERSKLHGSSV